MKASIPGHGKDNVHILAASNLNVKLNVSQLDTAVQNIAKEGYHLAEPSLAYDGEQVPILGLAGLDIILHFPEFVLTSCMFGAAFSSRLSLIPFGNILNFLKPGQAIPVEQLQARAGRADVINSLLQDSPSDDEMLQSSVNFAMSPIKSNFSPLESLFPESSVEQGLEALFNMDSLGHNEEIESDFDGQLIDKFKQGISLQDGRYHVELPWKDEVISKVPSNHKVAISALDKVVKDLNKKELLSSYQAVFSQQLADDIIEEIDVHPDDSALSCD